MVAKSRVTPRFKRPLARTFIREWRIARGMSLEELADAVGKHLTGGFTHASLSRIERQLQPYSQPVLEAIAFELNTNVASLLSRAPGDEFWTKYESLPPEDRAEAARYIGYLAAKAAS
jgi:transcriptional regulator with XRE-family HTH domain